MFDRGARARSGGVLARRLGMVAPAGACLALCAAACGSPPDARHIDPAGARVAQDLETVRGGRIFFAHQSVGADVLRGVELLARDAGAPPPRVFQLGGGPPPGGPLLLHALVGENTRPESKLADFVKALDALAAAPVDVALLKFCYADIGAGTDVDRLFAEYRRALTGLRRRYPSTVFVPVTAPVRAHEGLRRSLSRWLRDSGPETDNARRSRYNELVRAGFPAELIFDVARAESARGEGRRRLVEWIDPRNEHLAAPWTADGGHLNDEGSRAVARDFLRVLGLVLARRSATPGGGG